MYASHASLQEAMDVFTMVAEPDAFMWSSIISAHVKLGQDKRAMQLYRCMRISSVKPDGHVFVSALQACASAVDLKTGQEAHTDWLFSGVDLDLFVCNCLVDMYAKCGSSEDARRVFDRLVRKNVVTWNALIAGYSQQDRGREAFGLYRAMQEEGTAAPDAVAFVSLLQACASVSTLALETGKQLHAQTKERGFHTDVFVGSSLVNMYAKCGSLEDAQRVFDRLAKKKCGHIEYHDRRVFAAGNGQESPPTLQRHARRRHYRTHGCDLVCILQACASVGTQALGKGKQLHRQIAKEGLQVDARLGSSLVNMYAKCASLEDAQSVFDGLDEKPL